MLKTSDMLKDLQKASSIVYAMNEQELDSIGFIKESSPADVLSPKTPAL